MSSEDRRGIVTPADRLAVRLSDEVDRWMVRRGVTHRTISVDRVARRTLARCLKGENVTLDTIADIADALDCEASIEFLPRTRGAIYGTKLDINGTTPLPSRSSSLTMDGDEADHHRDDAAARSPR